MPQKKNNHYVPRFVLKQFSQDGRSVHSLLVANKRIVQRASIAGQCARDYFYGKDGKQERQFEEQERQVSTLLFSEGSPPPRDFSEDELRNIVDFIYFQRQRTLAAAQALSDQQQALLDHLLSQGADISAEELAQFGEDQKVPQLTAIGRAEESIEFVRDLAVRFLLPPEKKHRPFKRGAAFVIGDAPVASYNQWAESHPKFASYTGHKGIGCKGLQWFYPVAPGLCLCVFDPQTYEYGSQARQITRASARDVQLLNSLQGLHSLNAIYFDPRVTHDAEATATLAKRDDHPKLRTPLRWDGPSRIRPDGGIGQIIGWTSPDARIGVKFHFVKVIDQQNYREYDRAILPLRPAAQRLHGRRGKPPRTRR